MNWSQRESWQKMLDLLTEAQTFRINSPEKTNRLLEAIAFGIGTLICSDERQGTKHNGHKKVGVENGKNTNA